MKNIEVVIIGGGPAGMMAAIEIKRQNKDKEVLVIDRKDRILKKLLVTGNGRCNITNVKANIQNYFSTESEIGEIKEILDNFTYEDTIQFFENLGIVCNEENRGKVYPLSGQASSVVDALRFEAEKLNIKFLTDFNVKK